MSERVVKPSTDALAGEGISDPGRFLVRVRRICGTNQVVGIRAVDFVFGHKRRRCIHYSSSVDLRLPVVDGDLVLSTQAPKRLGPTFADPSHLDPQITRRHDPEVAT